MLKEHAAWEKQRDKKKADLSVVALQHMQDEIDTVSKKIKEMNGDFTKAFQEFGIQVELQPF